MPGRMVEATEDTPRHWEPPYVVRKPFTAAEETECDDKEARRLVEFQAEDDAEAQKVLDCQATFDKFALMGISKEELTGLLRDGRKT